MTGTITTDTEITVVYRPNNYTLTINYVFVNGVQAAPTYTAVVEYNTDYSVVSPGVPGFFPNQAVVEGTMPARDVEITVIYFGVPVPVIIDDYDTPLGFGTGSMSTGEMYE